MSPDDPTPDLPEETPAVPADEDAPETAAETVIAKVPEEVEAPEEAAATVIAKVPAEPEVAEEPEAAEEVSDEAEPEEPEADADADVDDETEVDEPEAAKPRRGASRRRAARQAKEPEEAPKPAPTRSRPAARRAVVRAQAKYVRTSARKARMVCGHIRGKSIDEARAILAFTPRDVARDWSKLLESAVANAENNHELVGDDLIVHEAYADEGPTIKRFRPRAMGRATPIRKRTSHLTITLTPRS